MKKLLSLGLALVLALSIAGCGAKDQPENSKKWDRIPMVMVDGELYLTTGIEGDSEREDTLMDGEITSAVDSSEVPTENDQSNFGKGYGYQYGTEGTIEIFMNEKWWVYATEEARQEIQFPSESTIRFQDKAFNVADLSQETIEWLEWYNRLTEEEQLSVSSIPSDLYELCGYPSAEDTAAVDADSRSSR